MCWQLSGDAFWVVNMFLQLKNWQELQIMDSHLWQTHFLEHDFFDRFFANSFIWTIDSWQLTFLADSFFWPTDLFTTDFL